MKGILPKYHDKADVNADHEDSVDNDHKDSSDNDHEDASGDDHEEADQDDLVTTVSSPSSSLTTQRPTWHFAVILKVLYIGMDLAKNGVTR